MCVCGGGGGGVHGSHKSKCYRLPIYNFVLYDYNCIFSHTAAILDSKMVSIIAFANYVDVKLIYVDKIGQTYIVTRHINRVFALYKIDSIITETFSELLSSPWRPSWIIKIAQRWHLPTTLDIFM